MFVQSNRHGLPALAFALALVLSACGDTQTAVEPRISPRFSESVDARPNEAAQVAKYSGNLPQSGFAMTMIGPRGGSLRLGEFEIVVPAGAVDAPTAFTIHLPLNVPGAAALAMAEFGPHGRNFKVPVTIRAPHLGTTAEADTGSRILWWTGSSWVPYPTRLREDGRLETTTTHFSEWGTEESRGITTAGGRPYR